MHSRTEKQALAFCLGQLQQISEIPFPRTLEEIVQERHRNIRVFVYSSFNHFQSELCESHVFPFFGALSTNAFGSSCKKRGLHVSGKRLAIGQVFRQIGDNMRLFEIPSGIRMSRI